MSFVRLLRHSAGNSLLSASGMPVPKADYCCSMSYRQNLLPAVRSLVTPFPHIGVALNVAKDLMITSSVISGTAAEVKSP